jgi:SagB-type dehydrogenase family enzyme
MTPNIGKEFMRLTRYAEMEPSQESQGVVPQPPLELAYDPAARLLDLPAPGDVQMPGIDLRQAIEQRRSLRKYSPQPLELDELSFLLWCTQGVKKVTPRPATFRTVPSAGARHALETYVLANRVNGVAPGLYRFIALEHALLAVDLSADIGERIAHACLDQGMLVQSAVSFIWVAVRERMFWRYGERGYRYLHLDAGHACQNLYLAAESIGCGAVAICAYEDEALNQALCLDGEALFAIYAAALGKKPAG